VSEATEESIASAADAPVSLEQEATAPLEFDTDSVSTLPVVTFEASELLEASLLCKDSSSTVFTAVLAEFTEVLSVLWVLSVLSTNVMDPPAKGRSFFFRFRS
jgi:hypothetical protein